VKLADLLRGELVGAFARDQHRAACYRRTRNFGGCTRASRLSRSRAMARTTTPLVE
jgi:hypothetical protein